jgi:hypothetical protein
LASGCSSSRLIRGNVEKRIAKRLRSLIGPADHYRVRILETRDAELVVGSIRRLEIEATNVIAGGQLRLDLLQLSAEGLRFRGGPDDLAAVRKSRVAVRISEASLNQYLERAQARHRARVLLRDGFVTLFGTLRVLAAEVPIEARGRLEIEAGERLLFRADQVVAPDLRLPGSGASLVERRLNPLVDLRRIDWPIRLVAVHVVSGSATLEGALTLPESVE